MSSFEGRFLIPEELTVGSSFSGFRVEESVNKETCHVWIFSRNGHAVTVAMDYDDYFTLLSNPYQRERILDQIAAQIHQSLRAAKDGD